MLWFYRKHIVLAARDLLGVKLSAHQRIVLKQIWSKRNVFLVMSRGMAKTFIIGVASLLYTLLYSGMKTLACAGESFRQGQMILEEADNIVTGKNANVKKTPYAKKALGKYEAGAWRVMNRRQDSWVIEARANGSSIRTYPMSNPDSIRGYRAHKIFLDERNAIPEELIQRVISPFANVKRNVLNNEELNSTIVENSFVHAGTIEYTWQNFAKVIRSCLKAPSDENSVIEFNYEDALNYGIDWQKLEKERDSGDYDFDTWAAENKNQLKEDSETFYGSKLVMGDAVSPAVKYKAKEKKLRCFMGIDPAREQDTFSITILQEDGKLLTPIYQNQWLKVRFSLIVEEIFRLIDRYNIVAIGLDVGGGGSHVRDLLLHPVNKEYDPIYDATDEEAISMLGSSVEFSKSILTILRPNAERNTKWNSQLKGLMQTNRIKFTDLHFVPRMADIAEEKVMKCMVECKKQIASIKTKSQQNANFLSFYSDARKKDLYSSLLYAVAIWKDYIDGQIKSVNSNEELGEGGWL